VVPVEEFISLLDHFLHKFVPAFLAVLVETATAEVVLVFAISLPWMMSEFKAWAEAPIGEERGPESGAKSDGEFNAITFDGAIALNSGVIGKTHRLLPALLQFCFEREVVPGGVEVRGGIGDSPLDYSGKTDRDAIASGERLVQFIQAFQDSSGCWDRRRDDANAIAYGLAGAGEQHGFEPRATDVDGHGDGVSFFRCGVARS